MLKTEDTIEFLIEELEARGFEVVFRRDEENVQSSQRTGSRERFHSLP